jgi:hypothetical protein
MLLNNSTLEDIMRNMLIVGLFFFTFGITCIEKAALVSNFFGTPIFICYLTFGTMTLYGGSLLFLYAFFLPVRVRA